MIIDSKGKLFGKISIIDVLVVLVILAGVAGIGYKFSKSSTLSPFAKGDTIEVQFYQREDDDFAVKAIKEGDMVTDNATGAYFGKVTKAVAGAPASYGTDDKGVWVKSQKPDYGSVTFTVEGQGVFEDGVSRQGVSFGSTPYFVNNSVQLKVGNAIIWADITSIKKKG